MSSAGMAPDQAATPLISVVIPCFNGERYLEDTVVSALGQELSPGVNLEVVVVDDGSTDRSPDLVRGLSDSYAALRLVEQPNSGVARARNRGLASVHPQSRYVMFLDADDVLMPGAIECLRSHLEADATLVAALGTCSRIDSDGTLLAPPADPFETREVSGGAVRVLRRPRRIGYWRMIAVTPISTPGQVLIRRDQLFDDVVFDPVTVPCEDWDLWLRLSRRGDFGVVMQQVLRYRDHMTSASKGHATMLRQRETVLRKQREVVTDSERRDLQAAWRYCMYHFDAGLCRFWAQEQLARRNVPAALRYAVRAARLDGKGVLAAALGRPDVGPSA